MDSCQFGNRSKLIERLGDRVGGWEFIYQHGEPISPFEPDGVASERMGYRAEGDMAKATVMLNDSHMLGKERVCSCRSESSGVLPNHVFEYKSTAGTGEEHCALEPVEMLQAIFSR
jgi:hypothetical protein